VVVVYAPANLSTVIAEIEMGQFLKHAPTTPTYVHPRVTWALPSIGTPEYEEFVHLTRAHSIVKNSQPWKPTKQSMQPPQKLQTNWVLDQSRARKTKHGNLPQ